MKNKLKNDAREALKQIPSVDEIFNHFHLPIPQDFHKYHINKILNKVRIEIQEGKINNNIREYVIKKVDTMSNKIMNNSLRSVINGTGIILHTGLGRAPISKDILLDAISKNYPYSNLEINLSNGKRGDRNKHIDTLFKSLCSCEDVLMVNNNASAVMLMINSICEDKEIVVSRGQLVEIGGSFRIPDVIEKSKCQMVEVGTTNKTHLIDYQNAITSKTAGILYVHTSNYKVVGFTSEVEISSLSDLAKKNNIPLLVDLGSGSLADFKSFGLPMERMVKKYIHSGADIITFSGDKLLGGPQAGIIIGNKKNIEKLRMNPIYRATRCDKIRISIMETILRTYYTSKNISDSNLSIKLFRRDPQKMKLISNKIIKKIKSKIVKKYDIKCIDSFVEAGSGSLPTEKISSVAIIFQNNKITANKLNNLFLQGEPPVVGYISNNIYHIDLKAIPEDQTNLLSQTINNIFL